MKEDKEKALEAGMNDFITKPVNSKVLLDKMNHWINQEACVCESNQPEC